MKIYRISKCKMSRREGIDLFLKSSRRSIESKCKLESKPGQHGRTSGIRLSNYGLQLREKQKLKRIYGVTEKQFYKYIVFAEKKCSNTGKILIKILESRLDNIVYRMGFGSTRSEARQIVVHKSVRLNGKIVNIPSTLTKQNDIISIREKSKKQIRIHESIKLASKIGLPYWVNVDLKKLSGRLISIPNRSDVAKNINESMIIELYSRN